jgi:Zn-dependent M28 family amino/carboxypeptidase
MNSVSAATWVLILGSMTFSFQATSDGRPTGREDRLRTSVEALATKIGERHTRKPGALKAAEQWVSDQLAATGSKAQLETYSSDGQTVANVFIDVKGASEPDKWIVIGAHYDSAQGTPGANDNGSGVAALIELATTIVKNPHEKSIRFIAFVNEEPPFFQTGAMGSLVHVDRCGKRGEQIEAMISIETIGCFSDAERSQHFPPGLQERYPTVGNFIAIVGDPQSGELAKQVHELLRKHSDLPAEVAVLPAEVPGVGWSDHWSFWQHNIPAIMVTDTAPFRYPHYHRATDTPDKIDYARMTKVVDGLEKTIDELAGLDGEMKQTGP